MTKPIIQAKGIGKRYSIDHVASRYIALRDILANIFKSPFSFLKEKAKQAAGKSSQEEFWAVKDVEFEVNRGEVVGIVGRNGAGKSTLLKILSRITPPTTGEIRIEGRVGSLLEVGTGFHPELTGRENVFLNGAILGMTRAEIVRKFDEIVEFAGVERFLDTPVKHYSSGMYMRLAFSVAAHMEPDILIVDEVLAVGDAEFQKKCLGKMDEITRREGRTVIFVSHNMAAIQSLCKRVIWIDQGKVRMQGDAAEVVENYLKQKPDETEAGGKLRLSANGETGDIRFSGIAVKSGSGSTLIDSDDRLLISLPYESDFDSSIPDIRVLITITSERSQQAVMRLDSHMTSKTLGSSIAPKGTIVCETDSIGLAEGRYSIEALILPQSDQRKRLRLERTFGVSTDLSKFSFVLPPDKGISERVIRHEFRQ